MRSDFLGRLWPVLLSIIPVVTASYRQARVSENDIEDTSQCVSTVTSKGVARQYLPAVCKARTRCPSIRIMKPVRLCRINDGRSVFARSEENENEVGVDINWQRSVPDVFSRSGPEGICCLLQSQDVGQQAEIKIKKPKTTFTESDLEILAYAPAYTFNEPAGQSNTNTTTLNVTTLMQATVGNRPFRIRPLHSYSARNIADLGIDCGKRNLSFKMMRLGRIVGGLTAGFSDWPWVAMVLNYGRPRCGGTLLSNRTVITAAHCVSGNLLLYNLTVRIGMFSTNERWNLPFPPIELSVSRVVRHPEFDLTTLRNDLAILQLSAAVPFAPNIQPACIASQEYPPQTETLILGWGKEEENNTVYDLPDSLQAVSIPIVTRESCANYFNSQGLVDLISSQHICAGSDQGGRDACQGDSGGPMLLTNPDGRFELIGIISWGFGCGAPKIPAVYVNIFHFRDWIIQTIKDIWQNS